MRTVARFGESIGKAVNLASVDGLQRFDRPRKVRYSAAITAESRRKEIVSAMQVAGSTAFATSKRRSASRAKMIPSRLATLRRILGSRMDIRLDANEAWAAADLLEMVEPLRRFRPSVLEQPVAACRGQRPGRLRPEAGHPGHARRVALRLARRRRCDRTQDDRLVQRATLQMRRYSAFASHDGARTSQRAGHPTRLPPGRDGDPLGRGASGRQPGRRNSIPRRLLRSPHPRCESYERRHHVRLRRSSPAH